MKHTVEGVGISICGHESDYLELEGYKLVAVSDMFRGAGAEVVDEFHASGFEFCDSEKDHVSDYFRGKVQEYRDETGREYPRAYRVKLTLELDELPVEEAKAFWEKRKYRDERGAE